MLHRFIVLKHKREMPLDQDSLLGSDRNCLSWLKLEEALKPEAKVSCLH